MALPNETCVQISAKNGIKSRFYFLKIGPFQVSVDLTGVNFESRVDFGDVACGFSNSSGSITPEKYIT